MSEDNDEAKCCASCGVVEVDDVKLKNCTACYLVRYCSVKCQKDHRLNHKRQCKKRAAELCDELLFKQPESSHVEDCPICCLPLSLDESKSVMQACCSKVICHGYPNSMTSCCSKVICKGCDLANEKQKMEESQSQILCPFCRHPVPPTDEGIDLNTMKRIEANDPVAMRHVGTRCYHEGDYDSAFEYFTKASGLGEADAHYQLSTMYRDGFVEESKKKELYHLEEAAIAGHPRARCNLAVLDCENGRTKRAVKHFMIAAKLGHDLSLENLKNLYLRGAVTKEDLATAIRAHQAAVDAMKTDTSSCCASCGIAEVDDIKLSECADCDLAKYCSDACQKEHKSQHEEACKKRAAELRDEILFRQPESSHLGDCPICCLPLPLDLKKSVMQACCSKKREFEGKLERKCPFCRKPAPSTMDEIDKQTMKRIEANDPVAMRQWGREQYIKGNYSRAFEYLTKAAELGDITAHDSLSCMYHNGLGVEKDRGKEIYHMEEAAIGGHPNARHNLGCIEEDDNEERAVKHWIIAATQGNDGSIKALMGAFRRGFVTKDDLAAALRAHQVAVDATKSPQRDAADEYDRKMRSP
ncbi:Sel1-like repeat family protein [Skeletonema marinoi]|uniref:Sel1-like repeat family protein n=1 Tax=Skeletonema marinoi TaxID=267567 RepID=A0AAD9D5E3_9STRA|nr:Sel1-like repeat family protein [Skeletonema marinoi]